MLPGDRYYLPFAMSLELFDDPQARDWFIHDACKKVRVALVNAGYQPWGRPKLHWLNPHGDYADVWYHYYDGQIRGHITWRGVPVVPIQPTEWDTSCG